MVLWIKLYPSKWALALFRRHQITITLPLKTDYFLGSKYFAYTFFYNSKTNSRPGISKSARISNNSKQRSKLQYFWIWSRICKLNFIINLIFRWPEIEFFFEPESYESIMDKKKTRIRICSQVSTKEMAIMVFTTFRSTNHRYLPKSKLWLMNSDLFCLFRERREFKIFNKLQ